AACGRAGGCGAGPFRPVVGATAEAAPPPLRRAPRAGEHPESVGIPSAATPVVIMEIRPLAASYRHDHERGAGWLGVCAASAGGMRSQLWSSDSKTVSSTVTPGRSIRS